MALYYQNVRGLRSKLREVFSGSQRLDFDIFALTETNLLDTIHNNELFSADYNVFRKDIHLTHNASCGRGVLLAVSCHLDCTLVDVPDSGNLDIVCVKINLKQKYLFILCLYIKPGQPSSNYQLIVDAVDHIYSLLGSPDDLIVVGDFNLPKLSWSVSEDDSSHFVVSSEMSITEALITDNFSGCDLKQISGINNFMGRQLDLVFSTDSYNCAVTESRLTLTTIDAFHPPLQLTYSYDGGIEQIIYEPSYDFNFRKADFVGLNRFLSATNFSQILGSIADFNNRVSTFYSILFNGFSKFVPLSRRKNLIASPPWYTNELRSLRNQRNKHWKKFLISSCSSDLSDYYLCSQLFSNLSDSLYSAYISQMQSDLISDPKRFWQFINSKKKTDAYPPSLFLHDQTSNDPKQISELFAIHFKQAFTVTDSEIDADYFRYLNDLAQINAFDITISHQDVTDNINLLKDDYSTGPDGIPAIVLKKCNEVLTEPISILFQESLSNGIFPNYWKDSYIIPVHKKGCKADIANYRPIAKLSCIPKLFEKTIYDRIYFSCKQIFSPHQHGFLRARSTTTNLTGFVSDTLINLERGLDIDMITTDFSKAFDKVSHNVIIFKLKALGFPPGLLAWIASYLGERRYRVTFRSATSEPFTAGSGVPQGSHLGPLLFLLTINDVDSKIKGSNISIFADDMKIYSTISSPHDSLSLQSDLNSFTEWCRKNLLVLNVEKCQSITFSRKRAPAVRDYHLNGTLVERVNKIRDLGVICDSELNFRLHFDNIVSRANSVLGFVKRWAREFSDPFVTRSLYTTLVRPILEYASQVWSPYHAVHINRIEAVQKRFVRFALRDLGWADPLRLPPYEDRLRIIKLQSLAKRREVADVVFAHQTIMGGVDCPAFLSAMNFNINTRCLRSVPIFKLDFHRTSYAANEPFNRMLSRANQYGTTFDYQLSKASLKRLLYS